MCVQHVRADALRNRAVLYSRQQRRGYLVWRQAIAAAVEKSINGVL